MLERFLPTIKDPGDYITALSLYKLDQPLSTGEAEKLLNVYKKYLPEAEDADYLKLCLAADLLPGRSKADQEDFAPLALEEPVLDSLFALKDILTGKSDLTGEHASCIVEQVRNEALPLPVRVMLARAALDALAGSVGYAAMREQIAALAEFLTGCGPETLDRYTALVGEVRMKCRI